MIYADACLLIYAVEDDGNLGARARELLSSPDEVFAISPLVMMETLVLPLRTGDARQQAEYESLFAEFVLLSIEEPAYRLAAELRAASPRLKTVDALHIAVALLGGCSALWTNDRRLVAASAAFAVDVIGAG